MNARAKLHLSVSLALEVRELSSGRHSCSVPLILAE